MTQQAIIDFSQLATEIKTWGREFGFQEVGISDTELTREEIHLRQWLDSGYHGDMDYMARHGSARTRPDELVPGTVRVISVRLNYQPPVARDSWETMDDADAAFISRYALGRDYHKVLRANATSMTGAESVNTRYLNTPMCCSILVASACSLARNTLW